MQFIVDIESIEQQQAHQQHDQHFEMKQNMVGSNQEDVNQLRATDSRYAFSSDSFTHVNPNRKCVFGSYIHVYMCFADILDL